MTQGISLEQLNSGARAEFVAALGDIFEHSPWVPEVAAAGRPFATLAELYESLKAALLKAGADRQLAVITAHPDLAGKAARAGTLTPEFERRTGERRARSAVGDGIRDLPSAQ